MFCFFTEDANACQSFEFLTFVDIANNDKFLEQLNVHAKNYISNEDVSWKTIAWVSERSSSAKMRHPGPFFILLHIMYK